MKKIILVPTDFSNNALIATEYALSLARALNVDVHILHTYSVFTSAFQSPLANETDRQRAQLGAEKGMREFLEKIGPEGGATITTSIIKMNVAEGVSHYASNDNVIIVVMGTHGTSGPRKDLLGSNTYDVAKNSTVPLLVIPESSKKFGLERAVFFTDYQEGDKRVLTTMRKLLGGQVKSCTLVHIAKHDGENEDQNLLSWADRLKEESEYNNLESYLVRDKERLSVINDVLDQLDADICLLTLVGGRSFFEKLMNKSLAREIILNPKVPILLTSN